MSKNSPKTPLSTVLEATGGIEPPIKALQAPALPLGHVANPCPASITVFVILNQKINRFRYFKI